MSGWRCAAFLALLGACTPSFQSQSQVVDLRVLAIRAEPAEAHVDLQANSVEPVVVRALVADPLPREALVVHGRVCFPTDSGRCDGSPDIDPRAVPSKGGFLQRAIGADGLPNPDFDREVNAGKWLGVDLSQT